MRIFALPYTELRFHWPYFFLLAFFLELEQFWVFAGGLFACAFGGSSTEFCVVSVKIEAWLYLLPLTEFFRSGTCSFFCDPCDVLIFFLFLFFLLLEDLVSWTSANLHASAMLVCSKHWVSSKSTDSHSFAVTKLSCESLSLSRPEVKSLFASHSSAFSGWAPMTFASFDKSNSFSAASPSSEHNSSEKIVNTARCKLNK